MRFIWERYADNPECTADGPGFEFPGRTFSFEHLKEYTIEAGRPDSITEDKLRVIRKHGVGRISINPQTMQQKTLDVIGRRHTVEDVVRISI